MDRVLSAPAIYAPRPKGGGMAWYERLAALAVGLGCLGVLGVALAIAPDPSGVGTHRQLGLERCEFLFRSGVPCPTCGMTTSFSHFVRGELLASLYTQPMGAALAFLTAMGGWGGLYVALSGRPAHRLLRFWSPRYYLIPLFTLAVLAWIWKILIQVIGQGGWG